MEIKPDGISAVDHMRAALSYVDEIDKATDDPLTSDEAHAQYLKVIQAAQHVAIARATDPNATLPTRDKQGNVTGEINQNNISAQLLYIEADLKYLSSKLTNNRLIGKSDLDSAQTAIEQSLLFRPDADGHLLAAKIYKDQGLKEKCIEALQTALRHDPSHLRAIKFNNEVKISTFEPLWNPPPAPPPQGITVAQGRIALGVLGVACIFIGGMIPAVTGVFYMIALVSFIAIYFVPLLIPNPYAAEYEKAMTPGTYENFKWKQEQAETERSIQGFYQDQYKQDRAVREGKRRG